MSPKEATDLWRYVLVLMGMIVGLSVFALFLTLWVRRRQREILRRHPADPRQNQARSAGTHPLTMTTLNTPPDLVERMPLYTWTGPRTSTDATTTKEEVEANVVELDDSDKSAIHKGHVDIEEAAGIKKPKPAVINPVTDQMGPAANLPRARYTQNSCAICLDDFVAGSSQVRELPCGHFFDPGCIDRYLIEASSRCPLCKKSVLSPGFVHSPAQELAAWNFV